MIPDPPSPPPRAVERGRRRWAAAASLLAVVIGLTSGIAYYGREQKRQAAWNSRMAGILKEFLGGASRFHDVFFAEMDRVDTDFARLQKSAVDSRNELEAAGKQLDAMESPRQGSEVVALAQSYLDLGLLYLRRSEEFASIAAAGRTGDERFLALAGELDDVWARLEQKKRELIDAWVRLTGRESNPGGRPDAGERSTTPTAA